MSKADEESTREFRRVHCQVCGREFRVMRGIDTAPSCPYCGGRKGRGGIEFTEKPLKLEVQYG